MDYQSSAFGLLVLFRLGKILKPLKKTTKLNKSMVAYIINMQEMVAQNIQNRKDN